MKINGTDIKDFGAKQWRVEFGQMDLKNDSEWVRGSPLPYFAVNDVGFKEIIVTLMVYGAGREAIRNRISSITALLFEPATLELDGYTHRFMGILEKSTIKEHTDSSRERFQAVELQFAGYEYAEGAVTQVSGQTEIVMMNPGNLVSPAAIELTPQIGISELRITGLCRDSVNGEDLPVMAKNLTTGETVLLDGIEGFIRKGNAVTADIDIWALPTLLPGKNTITLSSSRTEAKLRVLPLFK